MKLIGSRLLVFFLIICLALPMFSANAEDEVLSLYMSCGGNAYLGGEINIRVAVSKPSVALAGLEFILDYDEEHLKPKYTVNTESGKEMNVLVTTMPTDWEQMSYHSSENGSYHFRFAMPDSNKSYLDSIGELVLNIPFTVIAAGSFDVTINNADVIAIAADKDFSVKSGTGGVLPIVAYNEAQKLAIEFVNGDVAPENGIYYADIKATNLGDTGGIIALEFVLDYDKSVFKPTITKNDSGQMDAFMNGMPNDAWEQMCSYDESTGQYTLRFAANHAESLTQAEALISGNSLTVTVPFEVIGTEGSIGGLSVPSESIIAINGSNFILGGYGDTKSVSIEKGLDTFVPEQHGYTVKDNCLMYVAEKTKVSDFLSRLVGLYLTDKNGKRITDGYVCTEHILTDGASVNLSVVVLGDCDGNGTIDSTDYIFIKRYCFNTFTPTKTQFYAMAVNNGTNITSVDYTLVKRHCFGTYDINKEK